MKSKIENKRIKRLKKFLEELRAKAAEYNYVVISLTDSYYFKTEEEAMEFILRKTFTPHSGWDDIHEAYTYCYVDSERFFEDDYDYSTIKAKIENVKQEIADEQMFIKRFEDANLF